MELHTIKTHQSLLVSAKGRLDASWAEYFTDAFLEYIRNGEHQIVIDAQEMVFLSSAGIRSLLRISKELTKVKGSLSILHANEFVADTLKTTGFGVWLSDEVEDIQPAAEQKKNATNDNENLYVINENADINLKQLNDWKPWDHVSPEQMKQIGFQTDSFALGIGGPADEKDIAHLKFGDFVAFCGHIVYQPPAESSRPDYFLPMENFVPQLQTIQCLYGQGEMSHLLRFAPEENKTSYGISDLINQALSIANAPLVCFVILAEIDGLVGAHMIQSPSEKKDFMPEDFKDLRNWLSFCGERAFQGEQALIFGVGAKGGGKQHLLKPLASNPEISIHAHGVVFPYQALQNGKLDLNHQISKFFNGPPPKGLMHLIEDNRPAIGLGESLFIRGALWFAPAKWEEENL